MSNLSGNQKRKMRSLARLYSVQALFQLEHSGQSVDTVYCEFIEHRVGQEIDDGIVMAEGDTGLFYLLINQAVNWQAKIDQMIDHALVAKWPISRIDPTLRALFRSAGAELLECDTPPQVVISEYVNIARSFYPEGKEAKFANAILDHMAHEAKPEAFAN
ncbi:MAG: transcription antitermination factor NusB [Roseovarius sp.]|nr:transcription antitermination factor NusB [Roseovarius sp.]MCY4208229.1 transcription antitermination factor NusB [Roseovarius sp.]MCY4291646.1 transcription antitermination factor NusB [Roseovarius sp.]MCY4317323.1 transcription antitermination factor NusB [Roseovarius sp.]